jgi:LmbE family N-acetylglucosaminyl deacetylase
MAASPIEASVMCALERLERSGELSLLVVAAHPDDETVGAGGTLGALAALGARIEVLHVTDGAPRDGALRPALRDRTRADAAAVRTAEVVAALRAGGLDPAMVLQPSLGVPDQEAALAMAPIARAVAGRLAADAIDVVLTHPYEGGHPDHDAVALAVHAAVLLAASAVHHPPPLLAEMSSYHAASGHLATSSFLAHPEASCARRRDGRLDEPARARKRAMLEAFASQADVLAMFATDAEPLRCAPAYDFSEAPHDGTLHYETLPFGWTGARWRELARGALHELGLTATRS